MIIISKMRKMYKNVYKAMRDCTVIVEQKSISLFFNFYSSNDVVKVFQKEKLIKDGAQEEEGKRKTRTCWPPYAVQVCQRAAQK